MDIEEFRLQFIDELRLSAEHEGTEPETQFVQKALDELESLGELNDPISMSVEMRGRRGRIMAFDAYAYDEADGALVLIASDFVNERETLSTLTNSRIEELCKHMTNFLDEVVNGTISDYCDDSDDALEIAREFRKKIGKGMLTTEISRFKFVILTNAVLSKSVRNVTRENFLGRPTELNVWTLERFFQTYTSNSSEIIEIDTADFDCDGIQYLKANLGTGADYDAYMGIVPGKFLADI